ncbi:cytochrome P450 phenylacetate hydroxylase [Apiospora aurea]|uniref:Cytochrome P450 phenylacetate hydroxylase n=1 Tax=Apiospora aurea TaxID=335848 RepID=A0ABR1QB71_9PEZI
MPSESSFLGQWFGIFAYLGRHVLLHVLALLVVYIFANEIVRSRRRIPGLKGPKGWPIIGNLREVRVDAALKYRDWSETYGDVFQVQMGNIPVVVANSPAAVKALWITNSQALSSRPQTYTFHKVASGTSGFTIGTSPYDESLKRRKKGAAIALNRPAIQSYIPYLDLETKNFVQDLFAYGKGGTAAIDPLPMVQRLAMSLACTINWGTRVRSHEDDLFKEIVEVEEHMNRFRSTQSNLQDYIPILRLNPFNTQSAKAREMKARRARFMKRFDEELRDKIARGTNSPCIQASVITFKEDRLNETELNSISLSMISGGFETVSNTIGFSLGFLAQRPDIQQRAFEEICKFQAVSSWNSPDPLCDAGDDQRCTYVAALAKEALRYFTIIPLVLPRESIRDINYEGVVIPKGTTFYMNAWACNYREHPIYHISAAHFSPVVANPSRSVDRDIWYDPEVFRPERWIEQPDATLYTFGLGYRMCSAHMLAQRQLYLILMRTLSSFRLEPHGVVDCDPRTGKRDPSDLIMSARPYKILCIPRDGPRLARAVSDEYKQEPTTTTA